MKTLGSKIKELIEDFEATLPDSHEKDLALQKLEECLLWASCALAKISPLEVFDDAIPRKKDVS